MPRRKGQAVKSYKIYITKSLEAASLIFNGLKTESPWSKNEGKVISTGIGFADETEFIPSMYRVKGYYYAMIEYQNGPDDSNPEYSLIIC